MCGNIIFDNQIKKPQDKRARMGFYAEVMRICKLIDI